MELYIQDDLKWIMLQVLEKVDVESHLSMRDFKFNFEDEQKSFFFFHGNFQSSK